MSGFVHSDREQAAIQTRCFGEASIAAGAPQNKRLVACVDTFAMMVLAHLL